MGIGFSLVLLAVGAILAWGVTDTSAGIDVAAVGFILMVVGLIGLGMTLAFWTSFSPFAQNAPFRRPAPARYEDDVVVQRSPRPSRTVVVREEPATVIREEVAPRERTVVITEPEDRLR